MGVGVSEVVISGSVSANSTDTNVTDKNIERGPIAIISVYAYASASIPITLKVGTTEVWKSQTVTTDWDRDINKLNEIGVIALPNEYVRFELDNSANGTATTYKIYVKYMQL